ncbi:Hypothetical protein CAP_1468 [Chondromyces apiculatus DSM 436]|uniref:Secreted protein n=1 Tax=Chondromyces apiculatus DSM 436 TaxID=1192034 RepID=A0A017TDS9_9BACT|nr:Hypothetical protein CAP_1468 [Chondromyces apiculatus DSM 436]
MFQRSWLLVAVAAASLMSATSGCGGGGYTTDIYWTDSASGDSEPKKVRKIEEVDQAALTAEPLTQSPEAPSALVGVRHDLMLAPSPSRTARCSCLAVEVGDVQDKRFQWVAGAPEAGNGVMAVALSARGVTCEGGNADEEKRRPSISAVDQEGNDIVVEVEELPEGRPLASGAVIPRPAGGGAIYVKARKSTLPYARATAAGRCKVF